MKVVEVGKIGALIIVCDTPSEFKVGSCFNYNNYQGCVVYDQANYFTLSTLCAGGEITEEDKNDCLALARKHFERNYK